MVGQVIPSPSRWGFLRVYLSVSTTVLPVEQEHLRAESTALPRSFVNLSVGVALAWRGCLWRESGSLLEACVVCPPGRQAMTLKGH